MAGLVVVVAYAGISCMAFGARLWRRATPADQQIILTALRTGLDSFPDTSVVMDTAHRIVSTFHQQRSVGVSAFLLLNVISSMFLLRAALVTRFLLGPLSGVEAGRMAERLLKLFMVNIVSLGAIAPSTMQLVAWTLWHV